VLQGGVQAPGTAGPKEKPECRAWGSTAGSVRTRRRHPQGATTGSPALGLLSSNAPRVDSMGAAWSEAGERL
jgi:hypothetical protein